MQNQTDDPIGSSKVAPLHRHRENPLDANGAPPLHRRVSKGRNEGREMLPPRLKKPVKRLLNALPDPAFYQYKYLLIHGRFCNFKNPKRFSEKIFHRMRHPSPIFTTLADRIAVRTYIAETIGPQYLVPLLFSCDAVDERTFDALPSSFVMKSSNGFGQVKVVRDKNEEDIAQLCELANSWLAAKSASRSREKHYLSIPPRIVFEEPLLEDGEVPDDYKLNVFNSPGREPFVFIQHMHGRFRDLQQELYLEDGSPPPFKLELALLRESDRRSENIESLSEMAVLAKKLAKPFGYLRVDFYLHKHRIYVGELTVTPGAGTYIFAPRAWDRLLGDRFGWPENLPGS
ncbi:ATP-grasp fold amidoligase family protein [Frateuria sp. YIM B11624]|uniref:ATP-grasp fold amidoligase family protein n=1 Tax=Frateuria sp. YIM B11624 TaxID=3143185 RepID=UPI003C7836AF